MRRLLVFIGIIILTSVFSSCKKPSSPDPGKTLVNVKKGDVITYKVVLPPGASQMKMNILMYLDVNGTTQIKSDYLIMDSGMIYSFTAINDSQPAELTFTSGIGSLGAKLQIWLNAKLVKEFTISSVNQAGFITLP